jgi:hypothetical protein
MADDDLDTKLADLLKRDPFGFIPRTLEAVNLAASAIGLVNAAAGFAVKAAAAVGGWIYQQRKWDRVTPLLGELTARIYRLENEPGKTNHYVTREEFADLLEETLRRTADQPEPDRRAAMGNAFFKIFDNPMGHTENRRFIRLADELPTDALKLLNAFGSGQRFMPNEFTEKGGSLGVAAAFASLDPLIAQETADFLVGEHLLARDFQRHGIAITERSLEHSLSRTGKLFIGYIRG